VSAAAIKKWNKLKNANVYAGLKLKIVIPAANAESPTYARAFSPAVIEKAKVDSAKAIGTAVAATAKDTNTTTVADSVTDTTQALKAATQIKPDKDCQCIYHVVQPGDTLWNIAQRYHGTIDKLKEDNKAILNRPIKVGDVLKIFM
jgi:LysM repeat protein